MKELLDNLFNKLTKQNQELAEKSQVIFDKTYEKGINVMEYAQGEINNLAQHFNQMKERFENEGREKKNTLIKEQKTELGKIEKRVKNTVEDNIGKIHTLAQENFNSLNQAIENIDKQIRKIPGLSKEVIEPQNENIPAENLATEPAITTLPIEDFDSLNVKNVVNELKGLSRDQLLAIKDHEENNKNRKTVINTINQKL